MEVYGRPGHLGGRCPLSMSVSLQQTNGLCVEENTLILCSTIDMQHIPDLEYGPESQLKFIDPGSAGLKQKINRPAGSYLLGT